MSDIAKTNCGIEKTASEFHDDFILYGLKYEEFYCPFCFIGLFAKGIYIEGPQGKSPHFSHFPKKPHRNGCDGYPIVNGESTKGTKAENKIKIGKDEFSFPEKLVPRSKVVQKKFVEDLSKILEADTTEKVKERREKAGKERGASKYTSALVRSFASSRKAIIALVYKLATKEKLSNKDRSKLLKETLSQVPLDLNGYKTNYQSAFYGTKFFIQYTKIWFGKGTVKINAKKVYILSEQKTVLEKEGETKELDFYVTVNIPEELDKQPACHRTVIQRLVSGREKNMLVKWYGLGDATLREEQGVVVVEINNLDHIFIEKI